MAIKDSEIFALLDKLGDHYQRNIDNQHVRKAFTSLPLPNSTWDMVDTLTSKSSHYRYQGYPYQELYDQILAAASFVYHVRKQILPNLRSLVGMASPGQEVVVKMVVNNFPTNLSIFADMLNELYMKATNLDRQENRAPVYERTPDLAQIGHYLIN